MKKRVSTQIQAACLISACLLTNSIYAGNALFNVSFVKNRESDGGYLTIKSQISNRHYPKAGVLITTPGYEVSNCTVNPKNGWCMFAANKLHPKTFKIRRKAGFQDGLPSQMNVKVALNAASKQPISAQDVVVTTTTPGRIIGYVYGWESAVAASSIAQAGYTHVLIAFGLFNTASGQAGTINLDAISGFDLASYISNLHSYGIKVLLSIGGASTSIANTTVSFDEAVQLATSPADFETTFIDSMQSIASTYGFDGFDFDLESGLNAASSFSNPDQDCSSNTYSPTCDISYLSYIINTYRAANPTKMITLVPQIANIAATSGFSSIWGNYASLIMQTYSSLEWVAFQNYNSGCAYGIDLVCYPTDGSDSNGLVDSTDPVVAFATDLLASWPAYTTTGQATGFQPYISYLNPSQVVIGYVVNNSSGTSDGTPSVSNYLTIAQNSIQCLRSGASSAEGAEYCSTYIPPAVYSNIGGVFDWTINYDATNNFQFATTMYPCVVEGNCG